MRVRSHLKCLTTRLFNINKYYIQNINYHVFVRVEQGSASYSISAIDLRLTFKSNIEDYVAIHNVLKVDVTPIFSFLNTSYLTLASIAVSKTQ